jgi:hypothetical protein
LTYLETRQQLKLNGKPDKVKKVYKIAPQSKKRIKEQAEYVKIVKEFMEVSDRCELKVVGICTGTASGLHHMKKRVGFFTDKRYLKRACSACNQFAEQFPLKSIELGISLSKFTK